MNFSDNKTDDIITFLYQNVTSYKDASLVKDTTRIKSIKYDCYFDSTISAPLSFTVFELSDSGELIVDSAEKIALSEAAFFLFVNPKHSAVIAIKNTIENQKKIIRREPVQNYKVKFID